MANDVVTSPGNYIRVVPDHDLVRGLRLQRGVGQGLVLQLRDGGLNPDPADHRHRPRCRGIAGDVDPAGMSATALFTAPS